MIKHVVATVKAGRAVWPESHNGCSVYYAVLQTNKTSPQSISLCSNRRGVVSYRAGFFLYLVAEDLKSCPVFFPPILLDALQIFVHLIKLRSGKE